MQLKSLFSDLKAWMTTVPNKMNKAEKIRDRRGIISRLETIKDVSQKTSNILSFKKAELKDVLEPVIVQDIIGNLRQVIRKRVDPSD